MSPEPQAVIKSETSVGIVGGGPAGLMLSHLLSRAGVESVVVEQRTRLEIEQTVRAGILEADSVDLLVGSGVSDRVMREGIEHEGIDLRFAGQSHRIDFRGLVGHSCWLYPQTDVFIDLADARQRDQGVVFYDANDTQVDDLTSDHPRIRFRDSHGQQHQLSCRYIVGADGSHSMCRRQIPEHRRTHYFREYPFAWFGILTEAPKSAPELVYAHSPRGFALISQRTDTLQRMYFQCSPAEQVDDWPDERIWHELQARVSGPDGFHLNEGPITSKSILGFRSFVAEPMRYGNLFLAGDAAHTVPPTGAKGLNLALADVRVLAEALEQAIVGGHSEGLDRYESTALQRVWKAQQFSYWMTSMLHSLPDTSAFDHRRQLGELTSITGSTHGMAFLAEAYTGWPSS